ncbi:hypothetical protein EXIGLDRAFT_358400 [Exidia glandulosa HHB12029]|uniref:Uncharacterized protein n=1 Tax=Exidia glandulosa HHB12029 TaxID=1314781 RepID=A0A165C8M8_EXIGL|nr:hypothetical protein EXIGLDRAFT_358400 [Exidia glandulosa HHB12029]
MQILGPSCPTTLRNEECTMACRHGNAAQRAPYKTPMRKVRMLLSHRTRGSASRLHREQPRYSNMQSWSCKTSVARIVATVQGSCIPTRCTRLPQNQLIGTARLALSIEKARGPCKEATVSQGDCSVRARSAGTARSERRSPSTLRYRGQLATDVRVVVECTTSSRRPLRDMKKAISHEEHLETRAPEK